jgi:rhamnosyltransferase
VANDNTFGSICAVVVTYNIGNGFDTCFNSLKGQVDHAVVVNTSTDDGITARALARLAEHNPDFVHVVECPENNLGMAQNMGIELALELDHDWVLLLDHDSRLGAGMISAMERSYEAAPNRLNIGLIAPNLHDPNVNAPQRYLRAWFGYWFEQKGFDDHTPDIDHVLCVAASGSLIPARVLRQDELRMDESFVIDYIDTDFCLHLNTEGLRILAVRDAKLIHKIGERKQHKLLGITVTTTNHSAMRRYYLYRNRLKTWRRYGMERPSFLIFDLMRTVYEMWRIIFLESDKNDKLQAIVNGIWDGLRGVRGPRPGTDITRTKAMKHHRAAG